MSVQPLEPRLSPEKQAVCTKKDLINGVMASLQGNEPDKAVNLYRRCKEDVGYELMNLVGRGPLAKPLADVFLQAKDYYKAAQVFESLEMKKEAAQNFAKGGDFGSAADMYGQLGDVASCAEMFERGGSYGRAAPLFAQAGRWPDAGRNYQLAEERFLAGEAFVRARDKQKALECLQKVSTDDPSYAQSVSLLGPILDEMGFSELAIQKYQEITQNAAIDSENMGVYYGLAKLYESTGQVDTAKGIYAQILEKDLTYKDVRQRYQSLKEGGQEVASAPTPAPGGDAEVPHLVHVEEDRSFFEENILFRDLTFDEIRSVLNLADRVDYKAGERIVHENGAFPGIIINQKGQLDIGMNMDGKDIRIARFEVGEHFGEMTVVGPQKAKVTVVAATDGSYILIPREKLQALLESNAQLKGKILKNTLAALDDHLLGAKEIIKQLWSRGKTAAKT